MKEIKDNKKLEDYCNRYQIQTHFSDWTRIKKKLVRYKRGEIIELYGGKSSKLFFLVNGTIRFTCIASNFEEYFFFDAINEGLFGEVEYLIDVPLITQSEVLDDCECIVIPINENKDILDNDAVFQKFAGQVLARKYNNMRNQYMNVETSSLRSRLSAYLYNNHNQNDTLPNLSKMARYLRCSYRHLLREIKFLCDADCLIHLDKKGKYRIIDHLSLKEYMDDTKEQ